MRVAIVAAVLLGAQGYLWADVIDWSTVPVINHSTYQSTNAYGESNYAGGFPVRLIGVVLNNTEDRYNPAAAYDPVGIPWNMGGQAELYVQAVNLDGTPYDPFPSAAYNDTAGTAAWMGQNYGNTRPSPEPLFSYSNTAWTAELGRLGILGGDGITATIAVRAGDLVEIRARAGLFYGGKQNVNEQHSMDADKDFEIVVLEKGFGLPAATLLSLADVKDTAGVFCSATLESLQMTRVELTHVSFVDGTNWGTDRTVQVTDGQRTFPLYLGLNESFAFMPMPSGYFDVTGILDQSDSTLPHDSGYRLLVMNAADFVAVPEPALLGVFATAAVLLVRRRRG